MKTNNRMIRMNDEIKKELSEIFRSELKDPRINMGSLVSVVRTETTSDLKYCKVYYSVLGNDEQRKAVAEGIKNASGFIRKQIADRVNLRITPEFKYILDDSLEYSIKLTKLIEEVNKDS